MKPLSAVTSQSPLHASPSTDAMPDLPQWERTMRAAVSAARAGRAQAAEAGYRDGLELAYALLDHPPPSRADDCIAALVVSHHNLSDARLACGDLDGAVALLCAAHETLISLHLDIRRPADLRAAALRHTRETHLALVSHASDHGMHPQCERVLALARRALAPQRGRPH